MFDSNLLEAKFARIAARLKVADRNTRRRFVPETTVRLDVRSDREGEFFEVAGRPDGAVSVEVLDVQPADRHLLLLVREEGQKHKFLCGHDERHWFVAAVPESAPVGTVRAAKEALKPAEVQAAQARKGLRARARNRRKNAAYRRQGEWFFVPAPNLVVREDHVHRNEALVRGNGGKPHMAEFCYRRFGETVYVCRLYPNGVDQQRYKWLIKNDPQAANQAWRTMRRNAEVYVRGQIRHADHRTITLPGWHRVFMNTENQAQAMRNVAFLD
jgi:hypothetical protein